MHSITKAAIITFILTLLVSSVLFISQYNTVDRWQQKAIKIAKEKEKESKSLRPVAQDCPEWVRQSPFVIALGLWISLFSNVVTLVVSMISMSFMFITYKRKQE